MIINVVKLYIFIKPIYFMIFKIKLINFFKLSHLARRKKKTKTHWELNGKKSKAYNYEI